MSAILHKALWACLSATLCTLVGVVSASAAPLLKGPSAAEGWNMSVFVETPIHDMCVGSKNIIGVRSNLVWQTSYGSVPTPVKGSKIAGGHVWSQIGDATPNAWSFNVMLRPNYQEVTYTAPGKPGEESILVFSEYYDGETLYHDETRLEFRVIHCKYSIKFDGTRTASGTMPGGGTASSLQKVHGEGHLEVQPDLYPSGDSLVSGSGNTHYSLESAAISGGGGNASRTSQPDGDSTFRVWGSTTPDDLIKVAVTLDPVQAGPGGGQACLAGKCISGEIQGYTANLSSPALEEVFLSPEGGMVPTVPDVKQVLELTIKTNYEITLTPED